MTKTSIEWTDDVWNPVRGCTKVSAGCKNCYAETFAERWRGVAGHPYEQGFDLRLVPRKLTEPLMWRKPRRVFVNSMSDLFHESIPNEYIAAVFGVMAVTPRHTYQVLTKRSRRMREWFEWLADSPAMKIGDACINEDVVGSESLTVYEDFDCFAHNVVERTWPIPNVWLGVSVENQQAADERIPDLLATPAAVRWISAEPLLGPVSLESSLGGTLWIGGQRGCNGTHRGPGGEDLHHHHDDRCKRGLDWVVAGGESGPGARPMHPAWARSIRDQCVSAGVPFFFKQWGNNAPNWYTNAAGSKVEGSEWMERRSKKLAGRELDGRTWDEYPQVPA